MNILRRRVLATEKKVKENPGDGKGGRRIEVTVERETITMLVRRQAMENRNAPAAEEQPPREIDGVKADLPPAPPIGPTEKGESQ
jgi:hypothetical protein